MTEQTVDIFQIHWQNPDPESTDQTEFVVQGSVVELESQNVDPFLWIRNQIEIHRASCPDNWIPLVIWGDHPAMLLAPIV